jgi:NAD(P) transhydrogenase subunit alpha
MQQEAMAELCAKSDVVIAAAQVFGRKAPVIVTNEMLDGMKPGSVVVDLAVATGGNVESTVPGKEIRRKGVLIVGRTDLERHVPASASQMFSSNLYNFVEHFWDKEAKTFVLDRHNEIIQNCLITHEGEVVSARVKEAIG